MIQKTRTSQYECRYNLVWSTRYKQEVFTKEQDIQEMADIIRMIAKQNDIEVEGIKVQLNYIHIIVSFPPKFSISHVVKTLKGGSARIWLTRYPELKDTLISKHLWSSTYLVKTTGFMELDDVRNHLNTLPESFNGGRKRKDLKK